MARRTKEEAAATREHLLDTAERVFAERGVTRASLQDIATAAGLTRGAIYWHFKDKAELFIAMMDRVCLPCETALDGVTQASQSGIEARLRSALLQPLQLLCEDDRARRVFTIVIHRTEYNDEMDPVRQRHRSAIADCDARIAALLREGQTKGRFRPELDAGALASAMLCLVDGLLTRATLEADPQPTLVAAEVAVDVWIDGLRRPAAAP